MRKAAEEAVGGGAILGRYPAPAWSALFEVERDVLVLLAPQSAGGVDEPLAGVADSRFEEIALQPFQRGKVLRLDAPARIGPAAERAQLRAGSVDQHRVRGLWHIYNGDLCPRAGRASAKAGEATRIGVVREHLRAARREKERFAARAGAEVEHRRAGRERAEQLAPLVLRLEPAAPPGVEREEVGALGDDIEGVGGSRRGMRLEALRRQLAGELVASAEEPIGAQADRTSLSRKTSSDLFPGSPSRPQLRFWATRARPPRLVQPRSCRFRKVQ